MRRFLDTRLARVTKAKAPRDLTEARHRSLLRGRAVVRTLLRERLVQPDAGQAFAGMLRLGDAAAAELAGIPDTQELRETDLALLARDHAGAEEMFEAGLLRLVRQCSDGRELGTATASPAELLAGYVAQAAGGGAASGGPSGYAASAVTISPITRPLSPAPT
ncbi:MAG: hypothetical protein JO282_07455 [Alphaproteobacteria bacterium]|nr:hypothetical protein [Alphaproteobacteria bacterium]